MNEPLLKGSMKIQAADSMKIQVADSMKIQAADSKKQNQTALHDLMDSAVFGDPITSKVEEKPYNIMQSTKDEILDRVSFI